MRMRLPLLLLGLAACTTVTVRKIPWRGDYPSWDSEKQKEADSIEGTRFYLPWPHLVVTRAFPVDEDSCFVSATLTGGGRYINFDNGILKGLNVRQPTGPGGPEGETYAAASESGTRLGGGEPTAEGGGTTPIPLSDFMSLEYLPDEREQYAVVVTPGVFSAGPKSELANRWMSGNAEELAGGAALPALAQGVVSDALPRLARVLPSLQEARSVTAGTPEGTRVTVRVHAVRYARPGLYPLLRVEELRGAVQESPATRLGAADDGVPSCSPERRWPVRLRLGSFAVETYAEQYLEVVSSPTGPPSQGAGNPTARGLDPYAPLPREEAPPPDSGCGVASGAPYSELSAQPRGPPGRLVVRVLPWASVYIDGRMVGTTPFEPVEVPSGVHCILLLNDELHVKRSVTVDVRAGETAVLQQKLEL